jgi:hypothetical protein
VVPSDDVDIGVGPKWWWFLVVLGDHVRGSGCGGGS